MIITDMPSSETCNVDLELPLPYTCTTHKKTNAGDLVNSVCTLAQPAVKYAIKTAAR